MSALITFFIATYSVTWGFWFVASNTPALEPRELVFLLGMFAPGIVALCSPCGQQAEAG